MTHSIDSYSNLNGAVVELNKIHKIPYLMQYIRRISHAQAFCARIVTICYLESIGVVRVGWVQAKLLEGQIGWGTVWIRVRVVIRNCA